VKIANRGFSREPATRGQQLQRSRGPRGRSKGRARGPHPIDVHVGARVRLRRNMLGLSQEKLGDALGVTFQQVQKYERGANRIGASRLLDVARILDVPIGFFFDDTDPVRAPAMTGFVALEQEANANDPLQAAETVELVTAYHQVRDPKTRKSLFELARVLASPEESKRRRGRRGRARADQQPNAGSREEVSVEGKSDSLSGADR
jgi:transcriptional regulator with XRE-family HTH domain